MCFNSKMVQLKDTSTTGARRLASKFQFQNGTIKRRLAIQRPQTRMIRFNSKMVQLKASRACL